ncbi:MAG: nitrous oxide reductase accessory protein NosL [Myxococcota bacterium]|nr:nitrous oxide reductase accessory protein NosL [Myxococcota bacterium]
MRVLLAVLALAVLLPGCPSVEPDATADEPASLADQEGAVCGMLVRGQSAPRGQVVHRDGTRLFLCSLGDLLVHVGAPSPHGDVQAIFVEVMDPAEDPMETHLDEHDWLAADQAFYVVGVVRRGIMGDPVLSYASRSDAEAVARSHPGAVIMDLAQLRAWWTAKEAGR